MGFFKKIGKTLKKNISFKNLVKVAGKAASFIPVVGNMSSGIIESAQANHEAKKQQRAYEAEQARVQAEENKSIINSIQQGEPTTRSGFAIQDTNYIKQNPDFGQIATGALGGALGGISGVLMGGQTAQQVAGSAGSQVIDSSLSTWFKTNWWKVALGASGLFGLIFFAVRGGNKRRR